MHMVQPAVQDEPPEEPIHLTLIKRGWRQGTIFRAIGVQASAIHRDEDGRLVPRTSEIPSDDRFVVVSQSCDIATDVAKEPVVEAFPCRVELDPAVRANFSKSFRQFEIDPAAGLMANAAHRIAFDKRTLIGIEPEPWPSSSDRHRRFSRWLGRRASRSAIPDPIVGAFVNPLRNVLDDLRRKRVEEYQAFNDAVEEIRIAFPESELPPYDIPLVLLLNGDTLTAEAADVIAQVEEKIRNRLNPEKARLTEVQKRTRASMSVEMYFATALVELEHLTFPGGEQAGAVPCTEP